ncbi:hypothetical protein SS50377_22726 [Spironucleus salmonicida]|uniref:Radial spoke head protein 9 homolog n=1 Tax=Spironucleus salmonicida TaxID=348837 RepID=V6LI41_9EUKA|nr:hypothetical protein SS50377_22726 [Spironucleus salmonicida]|eukprot:EST44202.1 hypothetical protein SS50377_16009 [Spironucleus salmonicida]
MELNFALHAQRLQTLNIVLSPEEIAIIDAARPTLKVQFQLSELKFFGRIQTIKQPYRILIGTLESKKVFLASADLKTWTLLPEMNAKIEKKLAEIGFGITCREPYFGKITKKLPVQEVENEEEKEEKEVVEEKVEEEEGEEEKEQENVEQKEEEFKVKMLEAHRLSFMINNISNSMRIVFLDAFIKSGSQEVQNSQFRGLVKPALQNLALQEEFDLYLQGKVEKEAIRTLVDEPACHYYTGEFDVVRNCLIVRNIYYKGLIFYVFSGTLVWGVAYDGNGLAYDVV